MPDSPEQNASTMTQPATAEANGTSETHADDTSLRLVDSPAQEASSLTNGHPPELHSAPESIAEDEESVEDDEEEDEEPVLKYEKMGGIVNEILEKDTASAIAVSSKLVVCYFKTDLDVTLAQPTQPTGSRNAQWSHPRYGFCRQSCQVLPISPSIDKRHSDRCLQRVRSHCIHGWSAFLSQPAYSALTDYF